MNALTYGSSTMRPSEISDCKLQINKSGFQI
jgi:hypothetical protein